MHLGGQHDIEREIASAAAIADRSGSRPRKLRRAVEGLGKQFGMAKAETIAVTAPYKHAGLRGPIPPQADQAAGKN
jgi:hypothetical protein